MTSTEATPPKAEVTVESDIVVVQLHGDYTLDVAMHVQTYVERIGDTFGYRMNLIDVCHAGTITHDARRYLLERRKKTQIPSAVAVVGASFGVRTMAHMVIRALASLTRTQLSVDFFKDEVGAREWLDAQRNRLRNSSGPK